MTKYQNTAAYFTTNDYLSWEMKRYIETTETPGKYGYFTVDTQGASA